MAKLQIHARIFDGGKVGKAARLNIQAGKIAERSASLTQAQSAELKRSKRMVIPGLIDLSVSLGANQKDELRAAVASGTTMVGCLLGEAQGETQAAGDMNHTNVAHGVRILPIAPATENFEGKGLSEIEKFKELGCLAISNGVHPYADAHILMQVFKYAAHLNLPVFIHPQEQSLAVGGCAHDGRVATHLGLPGVPACAETLMIGQSLILAEETGVHVHFCRLSSAQSVSMVADAKAKGIPVTADVAIHQLFFTEDDLWSFDTNYRVSPPFRAESDKAALLAGVRDGVVDIICSDHQPHRLEAKLVPFHDSCPGIAGAQLLLPLLMSLVDDGALSLQRAIDAVCFAPARLLSQSPSLEKGARANLCVVEHQKWKPADKDNKWFSGGLNHPFADTQFNWRVKRTISGDTLYEEK